MTANLIISNPHPIWRTRRTLVALLAFMLLPSLGPAQIAEQTVVLEAGWNALWLEVEPTYPSDHPSKPGQPMSPEDAFDTVQNTAIDVIASPRQLAGVAEFFGNVPTNAPSFNQSGWEQWYRNDPGNVTDLVMTRGNRAYLIKTSAAATIPITGEVRFFRPTWTPERYNLVGFGINGGISFENFFAPSDGSHPVDRIYGLAPNGDWSVVVRGDLIRSNEAYWIFCSGPSDYMGPVAVDFDSATTGQLNFGGPADAVKVGTNTTAVELDLEEIVLTHLKVAGSAPAIPELELITADSGPGQLELYVVAPVPNNLAYERGNRIDSLAGDGVSAELSETIDPQTTAVLTIGARRNWSSGQVGRTDVYRLRTGSAGAEFWLPVRALNNEVQLPADRLPETDAGQVAGLWVGEIVIDAVTSIVEDGAPTRPAAGSAPLRVLLHSDADGKVSLLSQVTVMQTKTADTDLAPAPVLVVNPARIPFFEGIKERNGKRVGLRLESVAYDMPRKLDAASQAGLLADAAYPNLSPEEGIADFLVERPSRPPSLAEVYHSSWLMDGALGEGKTVRTLQDRPLILDPFHRSNPFRHAFHHNHPKGPNIRRTMTIVFDADQAIAGRLRGAYTETIQGLIQSTLRLTGTVQLQRVSPVANLEQ